MASGVRLFLRLPSAVRQHVLFRETSYIANSSCTPLHIHQSRAFSITSTLAKSKQGIFKISQPQKPKPQANVLQKSPPKPGKFSPGATSTAPDVAALSPVYAHRSNPRSATRDWTSARFPHSDRILLYVAPDHGAFFAFAYFFGIIFLIGGYTSAQTYLKDHEHGVKLPWYVKAMGAIPTLFIVVLGTSFLMAPMKVIKSVTIVKEAGASAVSQAPKLRVEVKRLMPFSKPDIIETTPDKVFLDRNVPMSVHALRFTNYSIQDHEWFTERYFSGKPLVKKEGTGFARFNKGVLNSWPALKKNVGRIFMRDQMAYLRIQGSGSFKLDLQDSHLLDGGKVLERATTKDESARPFLGAMFKNLTG